jgi:hypothetical protein
VRCAEGSDGTGTYCSSGLGFGPDAAGVDGKDRLLAAVAAAVIRPDPTRPCSQDRNTNFAMLNCVSIKKLLINWF